MSRRNTFIVSGLAAAAVALIPGSVAAPGAAADRPHWVAAWGASPVVGTTIPFNSCPAGAGSPTRPSAT
jgi:hypothetical protein